MAYLKLPKILMIISLSLGHVGLTYSGMNHDIMLSPRMDVFLRGYPIPGYTSQLYRSDARFDQVSECHQFLRH